ncbi:MAG: lysylphosphatidylglycerol synthase transmembrane domain-containing protein [Beijerinckiaceae bacterium]
MKRIGDILWPVVGLAAVGISCWLLYREFQGNSIAEVWETLKAIPPHRYALAVLATVAAYIALAGYDRLALTHLNRTKGISWLYITLCSFTTYALSHNIGASVFSGGMVRYRAYSAKGLSAAEVALLVAFCSFTFAFGMILLGGIVFTFEPDLITDLLGVPSWTARMIGLGCLAFVALYMIGSWLHLPPVNIKGFHLEYPRLPVALKQLIIAPLEIIGAAGIIYFALPEQGNPGFFVVLGVFVAVFSAALLSQAPGGLGVMELLFVKALPNIPKLEVLAAIIVFRILYLLIPLAISAVIVFMFEHSQLGRESKKMVPPPTDV